MLALGPVRAGSPRLVAITETPSSCHSGPGVYLADLDRQRRDARQWRHQQQPSADYGLLTVARPESWPAFGRQLHLPGGSHHPRLRSA